MNAEPLELLTPSLTPGEALRDEGMRLVTAGAVQADIDRVDEVIGAWAAKRVPWSLNDLRADLGRNFGNVVGARVNLAARRGLIVDTGGRVRSSLPSTRCAELKVWVGAPGPVLTQDGPR